MRACNRATRVKDTIYVSGITAMHSDDRCVALGDNAAQTTYILDKIVSANSAADGKIEDVVRTRIYLRNASAYEAVSLHMAEFLASHAGQYRNCRWRLDRRL